jgi:hypothetical protein
MFRTGFFELQSPVDVREKLRYDLHRLLTNPRDSYAAFDFFVTASVMPDWFRQAKIDWNPPTDALHAAALKLCRDLANGVKHFVMERKVPGHEIRDSPLNPADFNRASWDVGGLFLHLDKEQAAAIGAEHFAGHKLAIVVLDYWEDELNRRLIPGLSTASR